MSLYDSLEQIKHMPFSLWIQDTPGVVPGIQTIHILGVGLFFPAALLLTLRLMNLALKSHTAEAVSNRLRPWMWAGMLLLLPTGVLLFLEDPANLSVNIAFRIKALLLIIGLAGLVVFERKRAGLAGRAQEGIRPVGLAALGLLVVWSGVIGLGRFIAYLAYF